MFEIRSTVLELYREMDVAGHREAFHNTNDQYEEVDIEDQIRATVPKEKK